MKKLFLLAVLAGSAVFVKAQDIDEIRNLVILGQVTKAKESIDKYLSSEKNAKKPEGWFWKAYIINQLSKDSLKTVPESSAMKMEAFDLFKKYRQMDPKATLLSEENNSPIYDLYLHFGSVLAIKAYQAKDFDVSYDNFKKALEVHDYSVANNLVFNDGYKFPELDTMFIQYAAIAAGDAKKKDEAFIYHKKLVDAGISGDNYQDSYNFLVDYYRQKKDKVSFIDILEKGKKAYPKDSAYWIALEIESVVEGLEKPAVFAKYDELLEKYPLNYALAYNYSVELFNYTNEDSIPDASLYETKLLEVLKKAIKIESSFDANYLITNAFYRTYFNLSEKAAKIKGPKPENLKTKKILLADATKMIDEAIPFGEEALKKFTTLNSPKATDKVYRKRVLTILKNIYEIKKDIQKTSYYDKMIKEAE